MEFDLSESEDEATIFSERLHTHNAMKQRVEKWKRKLASNGYGTMKKTPKMEAKAKAAQYFYTRDGDSSDDDSVLTTISLEIPDCKYICIYQLGQWCPEITNYSPMVLESSGNAFFPCDSWENAAAIADDLNRLAKNGAERDGGDAVGNGIARNQPLSVRRKIRRVNVFIGSWKPHSLGAAIPVPDPRRWIARRQR